MPNPNKQYPASDVGEIYVQFGQPVDASRMHEVNGYIALGGNVHPLSLADAFDRMAKHIREIHPDDISRVSYIDLDEGKFFAGID